MPVPVEVDELTAAWLTGALGASGSDVEVTGVEVLDAHSGTTGRARLRLDGRGVPDTVFVKLAPFDVRQREFVRRGGLGVAEARCYAELLDALPVRTPACWFATVDETGGYVMVLEDLLASGCTFPRPSDASIADHARSAVDGMARYHAELWESPRFATDLAWVPERAGFGSGGGRDEASIRGAGAFVRKALDVFGADMPTAFDAVGRLYADHTAAVLDLWDEGERTFVHGDPHLGNLFLDGTEVGFLDWAMVSRSPGMRDVAYLLCNSIPRDVRVATEDELLERYVAGLAARGVTLDADLARAQYRLFSVFSWVSTVSTAAVGSRWQPAPRALAAMERTTAALEDLDVADVLAGLLADRLGATP